MKLLLSLLLLFLLALPACGPRPAPAPTLAYVAADTATATVPAQPDLPETAVPAVASKTPQAPTSAAQTPTTALPTPTAPSETPTEISPLALTLVAPTVTLDQKAATPSAAPETGLVYQSLFRDAFDDNARGWSLSEGMEIKDGALRLLTGKRDINGLVVPLSERSQADVSVRADIQVVQWDGASSLMFGAGCRMNETSYDQYMFFVGPLSKDKAMLQMVKYENGQLVQMTELPQVFNLPYSILDRPVPFEFICRGKSLVFKAGTETIASLSDAEYTAGSIDLFIMPADKKAAVAFDQVDVSRLADK